MILPFELMHILFICYKLTQIYVLTVVLVSILVIADVYPLDGAVDIASSLFVVLLANEL